MTGAREVRARTIALNSPWDLYLQGNTLFIAVAGDHQIWTLDLTGDLLMPYAGSGSENIRDGPLPVACLAQPSGLASDGVVLYVADSEVSAIRAMPMNGRGTVTTIVGKGLFDFGDADGIGGQVRLQHPLGVAYHDGKLYVADTYNSKIKVIDPSKRASTTLVANDRDGVPLFREPGGLSIANGKLYVADTNAHRIRVIDLKTKTVTSLSLEGVEAPKPAVP